MTGCLVAFFNLHLHRLAHPTPLHFKSRSTNSTLLAHHTEKHAPDVSTSLQKVQELLETSHTSLSLSVHLASSVHPPQRKLHFLLLNAQRQTSPCMAHRKAWCVCVLKEALGKGREPHLSDWWPWPCAPRLDLGQQRTLPFLKSFLFIVVCFDSWGIKNLIMLPWHHLSSKRKRLHNE